MPAAKGSISNTPIGPFQTTVPASAIREANSSRVRGPMSRPIQPSGIASASTTCVAASAAKASAIDEVDREQQLDAALLRLGR